MNSLSILVSLPDCRSRRLTEGPKTQVFDGRRQGFTIACDDAHCLTILVQLHIGYTRRYLHLVVHEAPSEEER